MNSSIWGMGVARWAVMAAVLALTAGVYAGEEYEARYAIAVDDGNGAVRLDLDSATMGFDMHQMQEGESRAFVDGEGRNILVTRNAEGFTFDVDGKTIEVPLPGEVHGVALAYGDHAVDYDVHVADTATIQMVDDSNAVTIISGKAIDESTREAIRAALVSSGHSGEVEFIDKSAGDGKHVVKIIKRDVEVTH